jgi:hypothetical protein
MIVGGAMCPMPRRGSQMMWMSSVVDHQGGGRGVRRVMALVSLGWCSLFCFVTCFFVFVFGIRGIVLLGLSFLQL